MPGAVTVSIVSHGHSALLQRLVDAMHARLDPLVGHVVVTHNIPGTPLVAPPGGWSFGLTETVNATPSGFGANHNRALGRCTTPFFCVLNPDVEPCAEGFWHALLQPLADAGVGLAYPVLLNPDGSVQDNEREAVTPLSLLRRHLLRRPDRRADWASGACWMVRSEAWRALGGFDEGYHMYCEDTDFCLRLQLAGWRIARSDARALHAASRASRRDPRALAWHLASLVRLWLRAPLWRFLAATAKARQ